MVLYHNSHRSFPRPPIGDGDALFELTPLEEYDLNTIIPIPVKPLETELVRVEPIIPSMHGEQLAKAFMESHDDPDVFFYPFPYGRPYVTKRETYIYLEKMRRRPNVLHFAIVDKRSGDLAGTYGLGCSPDQATLDVRVMSLKLLPRFRGTYALYHATYLVLSHALDPVSEGGCGYVRCGWRNAVANSKSARVAEKMGFTLEGRQRCYEVSDPYDGYPYTHFQTTVDGTGRLIEDADVYAMTHFDWLRDGKKQQLQSICTKWK